LVEEIVEDREDGGELGERFSQGLRVGPQARDRRQDLAREGPDLIADHGCRFLGEAARGLVGGAERARERAQLVQRRSQQARRDGRLAEAAAGLRERAREQVQQALHVAVLLGEDREHGVRGVDQLRELLVLSAERFHQQAEVVDRASYVGVADFQFLGDLLREARGGREALERRGERLAVFL